MYRVMTSAQVRAVEQAMVARDGVTLADLMVRAGAALAEEVGLVAPEGPVGVLCGPGSNGGDGWVAARLLHSAGRTVHVFSVSRPADLSGIAGEAAAQAIEAGVDWSLGGAVPERARLTACSILIDALLGTGASLPLRSPMSEWCGAANECGVPVMSADTPTGVDPDTGECDPNALSSRHTVTFIAVKRGCVIYPGAAHAGRLVVHDLGATAGRVAMPTPEVWTPLDYRALLPAPDPAAHKNHRGRVLIVAGSRRFIGAAILAARGASRMGAGYVTLAVPETEVRTAQSHLQSVPVVGLAARYGSFASVAAQTVLELAADADAVVLGPGMNLTDGAVAVSRSIVAELDQPLVLDADGLNAFMDSSNLLRARSARTILTPHPGELARLCGISVGEIQADRVAAAAALSGPNRAVVLKGAGTVISGAGRTVINTSGCVALATAGSGDVLAGMAGTLLAQGLAPLDAGALAAYVHGRAGDRAADEIGVIGVDAEDLPDMVPSAIAMLTETVPTRRPYSEERVR